MRNWIAVFLFSLDHKSHTMGKILGKLGLYNTIAPFPFEHYCAFCAKHVDDLWWKQRAYFAERVKK